MTGTGGKRRGRPGDRPAKPGWGRTDEDGRLAEGGAKEDAAEVADFQSSGNIKA